MVKNKDELIYFINQGNKVKYIFFWGEPKPKEGVSKSCFSQWFEASFEIDAIRYKTAEHYMMAEKARLFKDEQAVQKIIKAAHPGEAKKCGRNVKGFDEKIWLKHRFDIVVNGNMAKFGQNPELREFLINTGENRDLIFAQTLHTREGMRILCIPALKM